MNARGLAFPKPRPRVLDRIQYKKERAAKERACRIAVRKRDHGRCRIPGCRASSRHMHHIVFASHGGQWETSNIVSLCTQCHQLVHARLIQIAWNADGQLVITADRFNSPHQ